MLTSRFMRRTLISKYSHSITFNPLMSIHTIGKSTLNISKDTPVTVYEAKEYNDLHNIKKQEWFKEVLRCSHTSKYMELIPFFIESRYKSKNFVLKMELLPKNEYLRFYTLQLSGVYEKYVPVKTLVPITKYDYAVFQNRVFFKQSPILDLDMIYANISNRELFFFDKFGEWHDEGVSHEKLNLENTYNEHTWFDEMHPEKH